MAEASPDVLSLVEFDAQWRAMPLPSNRKYSAVIGRGTGAILFDEMIYEKVSMPGVAEINFVRSPRERGAGESPFSPKSSALALLRHQVEGELLLMLALHLESGPSSDSNKVRLRSAQMQAVLSELEAQIQAIKEALNAPSQAPERAGGGTLQCTVVIAGDLNAIREEFVYGNGPSLFESRGAAQISPPLKRPAAGAEVVPSPSPAFAEVNEDG